MACSLRLSCLRFAALAASLSLAACARDGAQPSEVVAGPEWSPALAMIRDGGTLWIARPTHLDRVDLATGAIARAAGEEWARCPGHDAVRWMSMPLEDWSYPSLVLSGTKFYLAAEECGLWSFDVATGERRLLVDAASPTHLGDPLWNGKRGPQWQTPWGMAMAKDGDGLVACIDVSVPPEEAEKADHRYQRVELWSIGLDGDARERLAIVDAARGEEFCKHVVPAPGAIVFSTDHAILRFDRATRALTTLASGLEYGPEGLAVDDANVYYIGSMAEIVRVPLDGAAPVTLRPPAKPTDPARVGLVVDGDDLYFYEGLSLKRMNENGGDPSDFAPGDDADWTFPVTLGVSDRHVYFEKATSTPPHEEVDPDTGETIDVEFVFTLRRAEK